MTGLLLIVVGAGLLVPLSSRSRVMGRSLRRLRFPRPRRSNAEPPVMDVLSSMRDELLAGAPLRVAFLRSVETSAGVLGGALAACRMGADVPAALRRDGANVPVLVSLAALWEVCEDSGAALATSLDRLVEGARQSAALRNEVAAQLAGPRATMRVLAVLPVVGVGMGMLMGADPIGFLLGGLWGWACLVLAVALEAAGMVWTRRLVRTIESRL